MTTDTYFHRIFLAIDYSFPQLVLAFVVVFMLQSLLIWMAEKVILGKDKPVQYYDLLMLIITAIIFMTLTYKMGTFKHHLEYNPKTGEFAAIKEHTREVE